MRSNGTVLRRRLRSRGALLVAAIALTAGVALPTHAAVGLELNPKGPFLGVIPSRPLGAPAASPRVASPNVLQVTYHGGPVQHSSTVYGIVWLPPGTVLPVGYQTTVTRYFTDVTADAFKPSNVYAASGQYYDIVNTVKQPVFYAVVGKALVADAHPYPVNGCPNYVLDDGTTSTHCLTDAQIAAEIQAEITAHALPTGLGTNYFLFTPRTVASCYGTLANGGCYNPMGHPGFCAYHSSFTMATHPVLYANMPYAAVTGCATTQSPQSNAADSVLNNVAHEHLETMTDPLGTAWYDSAGNEIADKCYASFGAALGTLGLGKQYNQIINTDKYWLQQMWSNRAQACVQRNTFAQPVASFTYTPAAPVHGQPVSFHSTSQNPDALALKFRWTFPNFATSALANPTFTFAAAGTYTVPLVVWDAQGDQAKVKRIITVS